jgi:ferredoxin-type protein NapG
MSKDDSPLDRRRFFRAGLGRLLGHVEKAAEPVERIAREFAKLESPAPPAAAPPPTPTPPAAPEPLSDHRGVRAARPITLPLILRPPGALPEADYLAACTRCGECIKACPVSAILADPEMASGAPYILAERRACAVCESLACMSSCPTGALQVVPRFSIAMGRAHWGEGKCLRSAGEDCQICVDACPMGTAAIEVNAEGLVQVNSACIGCGVCQEVCPTSPRAIVVVPRRG